MIGYENFVIESNFEGWVKEKEVREREGSRSWGHFFDNEERVV